MSNISMTFSFPGLDFLQKLQIAADAMRSLNSVTSCYCVVPENIQTPTTEGTGNSRGVGGSEAQEIPKGRGVGP